MDFNKNFRFGNVIQQTEFDKNLRLEKLLVKIERVLASNGFTKCHIPGVDYYGRYLTENSFEGLQDLYKVVAGDGQMLALPNDSTAALLNTLSLKRNETERYFGTCETFSFLKNTNPQNGYETSVVLTCANGYAQEAEMCGLAIDIAEAIGLKDELHLGNSEIVQGIVDFYAQRAESKEKSKKILAGMIESESDFASGQAISELKKVKEGTAKEHVKELSKKLDNQRSIDGVLDLYEVLNYLEVQGNGEKVIVDPTYVGEERAQAGMVFYVGDEAPVIYGGRTIYTCGQESMNVITLKIDLFRLAIILNTLSKETPGRVGLLIADSFTAYHRALKLKADFLKNGLVSDVQYKVTPEEADRLIEEKANKDYLVIYVSDDGQIKHS